MAWLRLGSKDLNKQQGGPADLGHVKSGWLLDLGWAFAPGIHEIILNMARYPRVMGSEVEKELVTPNTGLPRGRVEPAVAQGQGSGSQAGVCRKPPIGR